MSYPRKVIISLRPSLASIFRIEAEYGRLIGSNDPSKGLKMTNRDITTALTALDTIPKSVGESSTAVAPSSMYTPAPSLHCGSILTFFFSSSPNVTS